MQTFQNKRLAYAVKESTLDSLITELLLWLLDERVPHMDDGSQLLKALNVLMLKILDNADRTSSFVVLINLLRPLDPSRWPSPASNETFAVRNQKFSDLVVKCLIKLTKVLQSTIYEVDLDRILQSIHLYLQDLGMEEIRRCAGADDKPLRMVKTVLHELVKLRGAAIKGHLSMVPIDMKPQPIILAYIDLNLEKAIKTVQPATRREGFSAIPNVKLEDVGGLDLIRKELDRFIIRHFKYHEKFKCVCDWDDRENKFIEVEGILRRQIKVKCCLFFHSLKR
ncbi:protein MOR1-like isoform X1 [Humulus lupulus]|uniref:protein MOR1-like isoform X1 n=1 Tax=Humulus lupulus TaxID=3486 RepID=UPI002B40391C|nr:protein MOR1-like isoform X1 [Humulus lupulus]